jgi:prepilin-type N-terminal cleavage/methylation domain-containing protein/prepilin-type processing-associated H-X9-DG protein
MHDRSPSRAAARPQRGLTLVELLVVVAIIATLMAILLPSLGRARVAGQRTVCLSNLRQVALGFDHYRADYGDVYPAAQDPVSTDPFYWLWMGRGFRRFVGPYLVEDIGVENPSVLVCPADRTPADRFERTSFAYSMTFYHHPDRIDAMGSPADTYTNASAPQGQRSTDVRTPAAKILAGEWTSNHAPAKDDNGWWNWAGTRNFLFADGHAAPIAARRIAPARDGLPDPNLTINGVRGRDVP